jgi:hypothetical protein
MRKVSGSLEFASKNNCSVFVVTNSLRLRGMRLE